MHFGQTAFEDLPWCLACGIDAIHAFKHFSSNSFHTGHIKRVNLDMTSHNNLKLLIMPCFGFLSFFSDYPEQKCQTLEQYIKSDSIRPPHILILRSLWRKFDIGVNMRQSIFLTIVGIDGRHILYPDSILVHHQSRSPIRIVYGFPARGQTFKWVG